jgi:hypothetical protein
MARIVNTAYHTRGKLLTKDASTTINSHQENYTDRSKELYKQMNLSYSKFYKMDLLCRSAFLCAEKLLAEQAITYDLNRVGIFLANHAASLDTDELYFQKSIDTDDPQKQPALFVYTLPNIMLGELSIRHGFKGEQCMWIDDEFNQEFVANYVNSLFDNNKIDACLIGWVDFYQNKENVFLSWVDRSEAKTEDLLTSENLKTIKNYLKSIS